MKFIVKEDVCIGCGLCESLCPNVYEMRDNIAKIKIADVPPEDMKCAEQAMKDCPVEAIATDNQ
jgi:ferredoxin